MTDAGSLTFAAAVAGTGVNRRTVAALAVSAGATAAVATPAAHGDRSVLVVGSLSVAAPASVDLSGNDMVVTGGTLAAVAAVAKAGYAGGVWSGPSLSSTVARRRC